MLLIKGEYDKKLIRIFLKPQKKKKVSKHDHLDRKH